MKKIGILTFHFADNIGAVLNAYGLQTALTKMGVNASFINFVPSYIMDSSKLMPSPRNAIYDFTTVSKILKGYAPRLITRLIDLPKKREKRLKFNDFRSNFLNIYGEPFERLTSSHCEPFDACIVGSDQVWNPHYLQFSDLGYLLPFKLKKTLKISYAASMVEKISQGQYSVFKKHLETFSAISVRESSTSIELTRLLGKPVHHTLDPTLLLDESDYISLFRTNRIIAPAKYILVYRFGPFVNNKIDLLSHNISKRMGLPTITIGTGIRTSYVSPSEFVWLLKNAAYVITNSYHGTLLSIKFKKNFLVILPRSRAIRQLDILTHLGLDETVLNVKKPFEDINYRFVDSIISKDRAKSLDFLKKATGIN